MDIWQVRDVQLMLTESGISLPFTRIERRIEVTAMEVEEVELP